MITVLIDPHNKNRGEEKADLSATIILTECQRQIGRQCLTEWRRSHNGQFPTMATVPETAETVVSDTAETVEELDVNILNGTPLSCNELKLKPCTCIG